MPRGSNAVPGKQGFQPTVPKVHAAPTPAASPTAAFAPVALGSPPVNASATVGGAFLASRLEALRQMDGPVRVDLASAEWVDALGAGDLYEKSAVVSARPAEPGERVDTVLADGTRETSNSAQPGDVVVTNPGGEQYIVSGDRFRSRYQEGGRPGVFRARGVVRAVRNPTGGPIAVTAPWGEEMVGGSDCWVVEVADPDDLGARSADRYLIGAEEFSATYRAR